MVPSFGQRPTSPGGPVSRPPPASGLPAQVRLQVVPAGQSCCLVPLHSIEQAVVPPQTTVHPAEPPHSAVQPPLGQPWCNAVAPADQARSGVQLHRAGAAALTGDLAVDPGLEGSLAGPAQLEVQFEVQVPLHVERAAQVLVNRSAGQIALVLVSHGRSRRFGHVAGGGAAVAGRAAIASVRGGRETEIASAPRPAAAGAVRTRAVSGAATGPGLDLGPPHAMELVSAMRRQGRTFVARPDELILLPPWGCSAWQLRASSAIGADPRT